MSENNNPIQRHHPIELRYAWEGIKYSFRTQPNFVVHVICAILVIIAAITFQVSGVEWMMITVAITSVIVAELINTALESLVDLVTSEYHPKAKVAKDVASAAVLMVSLGAMVIGLIIFLPKVLVFLF